MIMWKRMLPSRPAGSRRPPQADPWRCGRRADRTGRRRLTSLTSDPDRPSAASIWPERAEPASQSPYGA